MIGVCLEKFIQQWITPNIRWKILSYVLSCDAFNTKNKEIIYNFSRNVLPGQRQQFCTGKNKYLYDYFPFENDTSTIRRFHPDLYDWKKLGANFKELYPHQRLLINKSTTTKITPENIQRIKNKQNSKNHYWESFQTNTLLKHNRNCLFDFRKLTIENATHFKYTNIIELHNGIEEMYCRTEQSIMVIYRPYNNFYERKFSIYHNIYYKVLSTSPLQFLWKIRNQDIKLNELKNIASCNKIKGRSKLISYEDYLNAFMKL